MHGVEVEPYCRGLVGGNVAHTCPRGIVQMPYTFSMEHPFVWSEQFPRLDRNVCTCTASRCQAEVTVIGVRVWCSEVATTDLPNGHVVGWR